MDDPETQKHPRAGWYSDPEVPGGKRYWSGSEWSEERRQPTGLRARYERIAPTPLGKAALWVSSGLVVLLVIGAIVGPEQNSHTSTSILRSLANKDDASGAEVLRDRVPGQPRNGSVPLPRISIHGQLGPTAYQHLVVAVFQHLQAVWSLEMRGLHTKFAPPSRYIPFSAGAGPKCGGDPVGHANAAYCGSNNTIAWGQTGLTIPFYDKVGIGAVAFILAHEYGHLIQHDLGTYSKFQFNIERELNADCLAGAFLSSVRGTGIRFDQRDINTIEKGVFISGDEPGTPWQNPQAHGSPAQRQSALSVGIDGGTEACLKKLAPGFTR
jgi:uncharacterized protein